MVTNIMNELITYEINNKYTVNISQYYPPTLHGIHH